MGTLAVSANIKKPDGTAWVSAKVTITLIDTLRTIAPAIYPGWSDTQTTDGSGDAAFTLTVPESGSWKYLVALPDGTEKPVYLSADSPTTLGEILAAAAAADSSQSALEAALLGYEPVLGNPDTDGYILSSTTAGVRSWVANVGGGLSDGDKGDITVSGGGSTWTIDAGAVTYAKMQDVSATARLLGRNSAGAGDVEELSAATVRTMLNIEDGATADQTAADIRGLGFFDTSNDGTGSGLDADLLDGNHASAFATASHVHATTDVTTGTFDDARIAESNVTQHEAALTITESQISDLGAYLTSVDVSDLATSGGTALDMIRVKAEGGFEYRTAAQVLSDIGAAASGHAHDIAALAGAAFDSGELPVWDGANFVPSFFSTSGTKNLDVPLLTNIRAYLSELDTPVTLFQLHPNYIDIYKRLNVPASAGIHSFSSQALMLYGDTTVDLLANDTTQMRIDDNASAVYTPLQLWSDDEGGLDRIASHYGMLYYYNQGEPKIENMATLADDDSLYKASSGGVVPITVDALKTLLGLAALAYKAEVQAGDVDAEASTDGQILTSDGAGNAAWEDAAAAGASDMGDLTGTGFTTNYIPKWNGSSFVPVDTGKTYLTAYLNAQAHYIQRDTVFRITFDNTPALQIQALGGGSPVVATFDINATAGNFRLNVWENTAGALVRLKAGANGTGPGGTGRAVYVDNV